jgi:hypothetical protein
MGDAAERTIPLAVGERAQCSTVIMRSSGSGLRVPEAGNEAGARRSNEGLTWAIVLAFTVRMKRKMIVASIFLFGLGLGGASARASGVTPGTDVPSITPEMAQCVSACEAAGGNHNACWSCCVRHICPED